MKCTKLTWNLYLEPVLQTVKKWWLTYSQCNVPPVCSQCGHFATAHHQCLITQCSLTAWILKLGWAMVEWLQQGTAGRFGMVAVPWSYRWAIWYLGGDYAFWFLSKLILFNLATKHAFFVLSDKKTNNVFLPWQRANDFLHQCPTSTLTYMFVSSWDLQHLALYWVWEGLWECSPVYLALFIINVHFILIFLFVFVGFIFAEVKYRCPQPFL